MSYIKALPVKMFLSGIFLILIPLLFADIAVFYILTCCLVLGCVVSCLLSSGLTERFYLFGIFFTVFLLALLFCTIANLGYLQNGDFFVFSDQKFFYYTADQLAAYPSIDSIFKACFIDRIHIENEGAFFLFGTIGYIADNYFGKNSVFIQSIGVSFIFVLSSLFVYKIFRNFLSETLAYKYTLLFSLFSPIFYYSPWLLRDIHIAFFYTVGIYLVYKRLSILSIVSFLLLFIITFEFRFEHGLFFLVFFIAHLYYNREQNMWIKRLWPFFLITGISAFAYILFLNLKTLTETLDVLNYYEEYTTEALTDNSIGAKLYGLPPVVKQVVLVLNSQLTPLPPWVDLNFGNNIFIILAALVLLGVSVYWSYVFLFIVFSLVLNFKAFKKFSTSFIVLIAISVLFLFFNTTNMNVRRVMAVYPVFFIIYALLRENSNDYNKNKTIHIYATLAYILLLLAYIVMKFFL